ncbi:MAG: hypothetical protein N2201_01280 [candidate division WOR-3 bacterium]|nr:hypothetical protein [candidate division WOR-3 bacterium]
MSELIKFINTEGVTIKDDRSFGGEIVILPLKSDANIDEVILLVVSDLIKFLNQATGKMYSKYPIAYSGGFRIGEAGRTTYGLKVLPVANRIIIQPTALLESLDILRRYIQRIRRMGTSKSNQ